MRSIATIAATCCTTTAGVSGTNLDIGGAGPTPNDPDDADSGANNTQNWPQILSASQTGDQLGVTYVVDTATTHAAYLLRVDFYEDIEGGAGILLDEDVYEAADAQQPRTATLAVPTRRPGHSLRCHRHRHERLRQRILPGFRRDLRK